MQSFDDRIEEAVKLFEKTDKNESIRVVSHLDCDGICACSIMIKSLNRMNRKYSISILQQLTEEGLKELAAENHKIYFFTDFGSGQIEMIEKYLGEKTVFILDHHKPNSEIHNEKIIHVNPHLFGIDGSMEIAGSGVVFLFCRKLNRENEDLAHLAIIGAIGDVQEHKGFKRMNNEILEIAIKKNKIRVEKGLRFFGIHTKPLHKVLEYSTDPYIPEISGSESNAIQFLHNLGIEPKINGNRWKRYNDLTGDEKKKVVSAIILQRAEEDTPEDVFGNLYILVEEQENSPFYEVREFSTLLNATGRLGKASLGIGVCLNDQKSKIKAIKILEEYKQEIIKAMKWYNENKKTHHILEGKNYIIINAGSNVKPSMIGTIASILSRSNDVEHNLFIMSLAEQEGNTTKVSLRISGYKNSFDLREIIKELSGKVEIEFGGHKNAAGAIIKTHDEKKFIEEAIKIFEKTRI